MVLLSIIFKDRNQRLFTEHKIKAEDVLASLNEAVDTHFKAVRSVSVYTSF